MTHKEPKYATFSRTPMYSAPGTCGRNKKASCKKWKTIPATNVRVFQAVYVKPIAITITDITSTHDHRSIPLMWVRPNNTIWINAAFLTDPVIPNSDNMMTPRKKNSSHMPGLILKRIWVRLTVLQSRTYLPVRREPINMPECVHSASKAPSKICFYVFRGR
jgi:hypothetical protein